MKTEAQFVKPDDFYNFFGRSLYKELQLVDNQSNQADLFLMYIEEMIMTRVGATSFRIYDWNNLTNFQKEQMQKAIILEANYIIRNSDLFSDSGYDVDKGFIADYDKIQQIALCRGSIDALIECGLYNHKIRNRIRYWSI